MAAPAKKHSPTFAETFGRDIAKYGHDEIPHLLSRHGRKLGLSNGAIRTVTGILYFQNWEERYGFVPSFVELAKESGQSRMQVFRHLKDLCDPKKGVDGDALLTKGQDKQGHLHFNCYILWKALIDIERPPLKIVPTRPKPTRKPAPNVTPLATPEPAQEPPLPAAQEPTPPDDDFWPTVAENEPDATPDEIIITDPEPIPDRVADYHGLDVLISTPLPTRPRHPEWWVEAASQDFPRVSVLADDGETWLEIAGETGWNAFRDRSPAEQARARFMLNRRRRR